MAGTYSFKFEKCALCQKRNGETDEKHGLCSSCLKKTGKPTEPSVERMKG